MATTETDSGKLETSDLVGIAAAATTLVGVISGLAVTGALQQMERDHGLLLSLAFGFVLVASALWSVLTLTRPPKETKKVAPTSPASHLRMFAADMTRLERELVEIPGRREDGVQQLRDRREDYATELSRVMRSLPDSPSVAKRDVVAIRKDKERFAPFNELQMAELKELERLIIDAGGDGDAKAFADGIEETATSVFAAELTALERDGGHGHGTLLRLTSTHRPAAWWRRTLRWIFGRHGLEVLAIGLFIVGVGIGIWGMIETQQAQDRPSLTAQYVVKDGVGFVSVNASAHNLGSEGRLFTQIVGLKKVVGQDAYQKVAGVPPYFGYSGPASNGTVTQKFTWQDTRQFDALEISVTTSGETACVPDKVTEADIYKKAPQSTLPGCVFLVVPTAATGG